MSSVNGSSRASRSSRVTRITRLHLDINRRPDYGYSVQGNVGPTEHYDPFPQGMNGIQPVGLEAPDVVYQPVRLEAPEVASSGEPISKNSAGSLFGPSAAAAPVRRSTNSPSPAVRASAGSLFGSSAGAPPVRRSMNSPSPAVRSMMHAANNQ